MVYDEYGIYRGYSRDRDDERFQHYGTPRHSGRYPWGSGDNPYQRNADFLGQLEKMRKQGISEKDIAASDLYCHAANKNGGFVSEYRRGIVVIP